MSYQTITQSTQRRTLQDRVTAAAMKESYAGGPEFSESSFGAQLQRNPPLALNYFMWPTSRGVRGPLRVRHQHRQREPWW